MLSEFVKSTVAIGIGLLVLALFCWAALYSPFALSSLAEDRLINFYGSVLDQDDEPVGQATVTAQVRRFCPIPPYFMCVKELKTKTDYEGHFQFRFVRGPGLGFFKIRKNRYEFIQSQNEKLSFDYIGSGSASPRFIPDKANPVIFRLRKKVQNRTFLFEKPTWSIKVEAGESGDLKGTDFIEGKRTRMPGQERKDAFSERCDLFYRATWVEDKGEWDVILKPGDPNGGGILVSDQMLYLAPEDGYQEEWSFSSKDTSMPETHFVYLKTRNPSIYSRIEVTAIVSIDRFFHLHGKVATNPYGDRVLDAVDFPPYSVDPEIKRIYKLKDRLKSEAQAALAEGRLPPRPKIMALIEAAKRGEE